MRHPICNVPKEVHVTIGLSGAGKTGFLKEKFKGHGYILSWKDIAKEYHGNNRLTYGAMMSRLKKALLDPRPKFQLIGIDSTNLTFKQRKNYYRLIEKYAPKAVVHIIYFKPDVARCIFWNTRRPKSEQVSPRTILEEGRRIEYPFEAFSLTDTSFGPGIMELETAPPSFCHDRTAPLKWEHIQELFNTMMKEVRLCPTVSRTR